MTNSARLSGMVSTAAEGSSVNLRVLYSGTFFYSDCGTVIYKRVWMPYMRNTEPLSTKLEFEKLIEDDVRLDSVFEIWYLVPGKNIDKGLLLVNNNEDVKAMMKCTGGGNWVHIYIVRNGESSPVGLRNEGPVNIPLPAESQLSNTPASMFSDEGSWNLLPLVNEDANKGKGLVGGDEMLGSETSSTDSDSGFQETDGEEDDLFDNADKALDEAAVGLGGYPEFELGDDFNELGGGATNTGFSDGLNEGVTGPSGVGLIHDDSDGAQEAGMGGDDETEIENSDEF